MKKTYTIAEIGQAHEGSLGIAHSFIDAVADIGLDAIKFQTHLAIAESSEHEDFRINFSYEDSTRFDYWQRMEFTKEQWIGIKAHCDEKGVEFLSTPFSMAAVDLLEEVGVSRYKIGSGDTNNKLLLKKIINTKKEIILSTGLSHLDELDEIVNYIKSFNQNKLSLLQCTTAYPTTPDQIGLNVIDELKKRYNLPVGLSDHSGEIYGMLAASALGAETLEFHITFDKRMFGPDSKASLDLQQASELKRGLTYIDTALSNPINKSQPSQDKENKIRFGKSIAINKALSAGSELKFEDLETKKPALKGIDVNDFEKVIGKKINKDLKKWSFLNKGDLVD